MNPTDTTLIEQMQISDFEINHRMILLGLDRLALDRLYNYKQLIIENIDSIVDEFYKKQTAIDEISMLIGDADTLTRLSNSQRKYVLDLFSGNYNSDYVNNRLRIGMVHKRIGVEPKLYLSAVYTLKSIIFNTLKNNIDTIEELDQVLDTLEKLFYFDTTLVFDTYIDCLVGEIESEKRKTENYAKSLEAIVAERTKQLSEQTRRDPLTNIYNQRAMHDRLTKELSVAKRHNSILSFVYFDIDSFKKINDTQGHIKGDQVLTSIAHMMMSNIRNIDTACRYGGDEFCLILPDCDVKNASIVCQKIIQKFTQKYPNYSLSFGISESDEFPDETQLIKAADKNMYISKKEPGSYITPCI